MARESVQQVDIPPTIPQAEITPPESIEALWQEISPRKPHSDKEVKQICPIPLVFCVLFLTGSWQICEDLLVALGFLDRWSPKSTPHQDEETINQIYKWASDASIPSPVIAEISDPELSDGTRNDSFNCMYANT